MGHAQRRGGHEGAHLLGHALVAHEGPPHARAGVARQLGQGEQHDVLGLGLGDGREVRPVVGQVVHPQAAPVLVVLGAPAAEQTSAPLAQSASRNDPSGLLGDVTTSMHLPHSAAVGPPELAGVRESAAHAKRRS